MERVVKLMDDLYDIYQQDNESKYIDSGVQSEFLEAIYQIGRYAQCGIEYKVRIVQFFSHFGGEMIVEDLERAVTSFDKINALLDTVEEEKIIGLLSILEEMHHDYSREDETTMESQIKFRLK